MKAIYYFLFILFISMIYTGCKKDEDDTANPASGQTGEMITTGFTGVIRDLQGNPMAGVQVSVGGTVVSTNSQGIYLIQNVQVNKSRAVVNASKAGFWVQQKGMIAQPNTLNYASLVMFPDNKSYSVNAVSGGTVNLPGGTSITFPANAFVSMNGNAYSGTVYLTAHEILTSEARYIAKVPGGDMLATDSNGDSQLLLSFGMAGAQLYDAIGNKLLIAPGKKANIKFPVNPNQAGSAPATIPLWHYDETDMIWKEEGTATKTGNYYEGEVSHFTWWNCDQFSEQAYLTFSITDCNGAPVPFAEIWLDGGSSIGSAYNSTNMNGYCWGIVPTNTVFTVTIYSTFGGTTPDTTFTIGPFSNNSNNIIPPITTFSSNCNEFHINLFDCDSLSIDGTIGVTLNNQPLGFYTTTNGQLVLPYSSQGNYNFYATSGSISGSQSATINSSNSGQAMFLSMVLCDTISTSNQDFTLHFTTGGTQLKYSLNVTSVEYVSTGSLNKIVFNYLDSATSSNSQLILDIPVYNPGSYNWNGADTKVSGHLTYMGQNATIMSSTGATSLYNTPSVGNYITGAFAGQVTLQSGPIIIPGQLSATFNALRSQ